MKYQSTKRFDNFTVAIRQHKAAHSHCSLLHGYSFEFKVWFESIEELEEKQLDEMSWIVDFGIFSRNGLKDWLNDMFDHTLLIQADDPYRDIFEQLGVMGLCKVRFLDRMGCESLAEMVFNKFNDRLSVTDAGRCRVIKVEVYENDRNSAIFESK